MGTSRTIIPEGPVSVGHLELPLPHFWLESFRIIKCAVCPLDTPSFRRSLSAHPIPKRAG
eukprot:31595_5